MDKWVRGESLHFKSARWERAAKSALVRASPERLELAFPFSPERPFPLPELMCFARLGSICGEDRIIYAFDAQKTPIF